MADELELWSEFNVAMMGATAALAGLVIVAVSVNIAVVVKSGNLPSRLAVAISALVLAIVVSGVGLMPHLDLRVYGVIALAGTIGAGAFQVHSLTVIARDPDSPQGTHLLKSLPGFVPLAAYLAGSVLVIAAAPMGLAFLAAGSILAIIGSILISWIVLVEVLR